MNVTINVFKWYVHAGFGAIMCLGLPENNLNLLCWRIKVLKSNANQVLTYAPIR